LETVTSAFSVLFKGVGTASKKKRERERGATRKHPFNIIAPVMKG